MRGDRGDIVIGWLTRLVAVLAISGTLAFEVVSIAVTRVGTADIAQNAAYEGAQTWRETRDVNRAFRSSLEYAQERGAEIEPRDFTVLPDGTVVLTVKRTARSMIFDRFEATRGWLDARGTGRSRAV